jgi:biopolymer transport protein ExbB
MNLFDYINQGGVIMYILLFANIIGVALLIWKFIFLRGAKKNIDSIANELLSEINQLNFTKDSEAGILLIKEKAQGYVQSQEVGMSFIKIIATISPLLGLLGTVIGILSAFQVIAQKGMSDPSFFAGGISMALVTTVAGLIVSIPHFIGYNFLSGDFDQLESKLEQRLIELLFGKKA